MEVLASLESQSASSGVENGRKGELRVYTSLQRLGKVEHDEDEFDDQRGWGWGWSIERRVSDKVADHSLPELIQPA